MLFGSQEKESGKRDYQKGKYYVGKSLNETKMNEIETSKENFFTSDLKE